MNTYTSKSSEKNNQPAANNLGGKKTVLQLKDNRPQSIVQKKKNNTGLSDQLKSGIENLSGHSMDDVKVHYNSDKPAQLSAHAYAQGTEIHIASGQEKHLPHEAWHVIQQKQGRIKPTVQMKGKVNVNDDKRLEKEADVMGAKVIANKNKVAQPVLKRTSNIQSRKTVLQPVWNRIVNAYQGATTGLATAYNSATTVVSNISQGVATRAANAYTATTAGIANVYNGDRATDIRHNISGTTKKVLSQTKDVLNYGLEGITGSSSHAWEGIKEGGKYLRDGITGPLQYGWRGLKGGAKFIGDGGKGILNHGKESWNGISKIRQGVISAYNGTQQKNIGGRLIPFPVRGKKKGIAPVARYLTNATGNGLLHVGKGIAGAISYPFKAPAKLYNYSKDGFKGASDFLSKGVKGVRDYNKRGKDGSIDYLKRGAKGIVNNVGYFRGAALGMGAIGTAGAMAAGVNPLYGAAAAAIPYAYDGAMFLKMLNYQRTHAGYHSIEKHSAWHNSGNLKNRLTKVPVKSTRMRNFMGLGSRVGQGPSSGQFKTENWHAYSIKEGEKQLRALHPLANIVTSKPLVQGPLPVKFTIKFTGWDTGISHGPATPPEGESTEYIFYNFIPDLALPNNYFLIQHYPQTTAAPSNFMVTTSKII